MSLYKDYQQPFRGENLLAISGVVLEGTPSSLSGASSSAQSVVTRALLKSRSQRYQAVTDLLDELRRATARATQAPSQPDLPSIAVLPFANMSTDPENEFFADGISEDIINTLGQIEGLRVAARGSAFSFKGKHVDPREVGQRLQVSAVLEGSVRRAGNRLRITTELVNAKDGYQADPVPSRTRFPSIPSWHTAGRIPGCDRPGRWHNQRTLSGYPPRGTMRGSATACGLARRTPAAER